MARPLRIEYPGALYHVVARGIERKKIFDLPEYKTHFLKVLKDIKRSHGLVIHGYCLMDNHYHLQIETPRGNLTKAMTRINGNYSLKYNALEKRWGHVFESRYKSFLIDKENYLLEVSRYIHLNPVRAKMVKRPEKYQWSSYKVYIGKEESELIDSEWILSRFGKHLGRAWKRYKAYIKDGDIDEASDPFKKAYGGYILGDKGFVEKIKAKLGNKKRLAEVSEKRYARPRVPISLIRRKAKEMIEGNDKYRRKVEMYLLRKYTDTPLLTIAKEYGNIHYSAVTQTIRRSREEIEGDPRVKRLEKEIKAHLAKMSNVTACREPERTSVNGSWI